MIQKFTIFRDDANDRLVIEEFAVIDRVLKNNEYPSLNTHQFELICQETYDGQEVRAAVTKDRSAIVSSIRTDNMYPIGIYAEALADPIAQLYESENSQSTELIFNDQDLLQA